MYLADFSVEITNKPNTKLVIGNFFSFSPSSQNQSISTLLAKQTKQPDIQKQTNTHTTNVTTTKYLTFFSPHSLIRFSIRQG
jgi:hypothetical protein